ncbi:hypothetical protein Pelo_2695 [Pelomyxa schiedti]|nr:hypothetical protein Pelo_2695 [Pelomyxa schiedti]
MKCAAEVAEFVPTAASRGKQSRVIIVRPIPGGITNADLRDFVASLGLAPARAMIAFEKGGRSLGWAALVFNTVDQIPIAIRTLQGKCFLSQFIQEARAPTSTEFDYMFVSTKKKKRRQAIAEFEAQKRKGKLKNQPTEESDEDDEPTTKPPNQKVAPPYVPHVTPNELTLQIQTIQDIKNHVFFGIDFECACIGKGGQHYPNEIGVRAFCLSAFEMDGFHAIINPGPIPPQNMPTVQELVLNHHGIPLDCKRANGNYRDIWNALLEFLSRYIPTSGPHRPILFSKGCATEKKCISWLAEKAGVIDCLSAQVFEMCDGVYSILNHRKCHIKQEEIAHKIDVFFDCECGIAPKCEYHTGLLSGRKPFHCAFSDARAVGTGIKAAIAEAEKILNDQSDPLADELAAYLKQSWSTDPAASKPVSSVTTGITQLSVFETTKPSPPVTPNPNSNPRSQPPPPQPVNPVSPPTSAKVVLPAIGSSNNNRTRTQPPQLCTPSMFSTPCAPSKGPKAQNPPKATMVSTTTTTSSAVGWTIQKRH